MSNRYTAHEHQRMKLAGWLDPDEAEKLRARVTKLDGTLILRNLHCCWLELSKDVDTAKLTALEKEVDQLKGEVERAKTIIRACLITGGLRTDITRQLFAVASAFVNPTPHDATERQKE